MSSYFVDSDDQRAKARRAEQRLLEHSTQRVPRRGAPSETDEQEISNLPPVFVRPDAGPQYSRETSLDKRAARFRDTHLYGPPPPPPVSPDEIPRLLAPARFLVPQELANQGVTNDRRYAVMPPQSAYGLQPSASAPPAPPLAYNPLERVPQFLPTEDESVPKYIRTAEGIAPNPRYPAGWGEQQAMQNPPFIPEAVQRDNLDWVAGTGAYERSPILQELLSSSTPSLTASQKKRLRKKKAKERNTAPRPAPFPLQQDQYPQPEPYYPDTNGHAPNIQEDIWPTPAPFPAEPHPEASLQTQCDREAIVRFYDPRTQSHIEHRLVCPLKPFPHPGQPHLLKLPSALDDNTEIFIGWWHADE